VIITTGRTGGFHAIPFFEMDGYYNNDKVTVGYSAVTSFY
jgi:hypothetical protein